MLPDGRVLVAADATRNGTGVMLVLRLTPDGKLDPAFGAGGRVDQLPPGMTAASPVAIAVMADDRIVIAGAATPGPGSSFFAVARLLPSGVPDPSWDGDGMTTYQWGPSTAEYPTALAVDADGRVTVAGTQGIGTLVARYLPNGAPDLSFAFAGRGFIGPGDDTTTLSGVSPTLPDGTTIVSGSRGGWLASYVARIAVPGTVSGYPLHWDRPVKGGGGSALVDESGKPLFVD